MLFFNKTFFTHVIHVFLAAVMLMVCGTSAYALSSHEVGIVGVDRLNMRAAARISAPVIRVLNRGEQVRIIGYEKNWLQVLSGLDIGYIYNTTRYVRRYTIHTVTKKDSADIPLAKAREREIKRRISLNKNEIRSIAKKEGTVLDDLDRIDRAISDNRSRINDINARLIVVDNRIKHLDKDYKKTRVAIEKKKSFALGRITALYKLNRLGAMNLLASADSMYELFRRKAAVERVVSRDERVIGDLMDKNARLAALIRHLKSETLRKQALEKDYEAAIDRLTSDKKTRKKALAKIRKKKSDRLSTIKYLRAAALQMDRTVSALSKSGVRTPSRFTGYRGLLKMPVSGKIVSRFGKFIEPRSGVESIRNGIEIKTDRGTPVRAVFKGKTIYADWLKGYGKVIIIAHGDSYYTIYAHVEDMFSQRGDPVETGQVIATVGQTGSIVGPVLYFEIRHHDDPKDPLAWLNHG
ncbi:MAG: peptidoglycan DD-metalloendopeptidase family protein [Deltaproteobacteria bacterium]|nr:peptidoglycan DD-metalloendopeptidase family protein [Deltaproteobacteria bacterium]